MQAYMKSEKWRLKIQNWSDSYQRIDIGNKVWKETADFNVYCRYLSLPFVGSHINLFCVNEEAKLNEPIVTKCLTKIVWKWIIYFISSLTTVIMVGRLQISAATTKWDKCGTPINTHIKKASWIWMWNQTKCRRNRCYKLVHWSFNNDKAKEIERLVSADPDRASEEFRIA